MLGKLLTHLTAILFIAGCASNTPPPPATRIPGTYTAVNLPVLAERWVDGVVQLASKEKNGCSKFPKNILPYPIEDDYTVDIEGNRDIFFHLSRADGEVDCNKYGMFYATKGNEYTFTFQVKNTQCVFTLTEKLPSGMQKKIPSYPAHVSSVDGVKVCENKDKLY